MPEPLLSIVTPCLNQATWVAECLASVATEAGRIGDGLVEHIIMDGGSTDGSAALVEAHAARHPGLVTYWVSEPDGGQSDAINRGVAVARGRFATWLNADDWYEPGGLAALIGAIDANREADVIVGRCRFIDAAGETVWHPSPPEPMTAASFLKLRTHWFNAKMIVQPEAIFRVSAFTDVGGLNVDNHYSMDHELWIELALSGARFVSIDSPVACLRVHSEQKSADNRSLVRSMLVTGKRVVGEHTGALGDELATVRRELDGVASKLHIADALIARFDVARAVEAGGATGGRGATGGGGASGGGGEKGGTAGPRLQGAASQPSETKKRVELELRELAQPHTRKALKLAAKHVGKRVRVCAHTATPDALNADLSHAFRKIELVGAGDDAGVKKRGGVDVVVLDNVLTTEVKPEAVIRSLWSVLRPGGVLVVLNELSPATGLMGYLDSLEVHLNNHLAANNDLVLHPDADAYVLNVDPEREPPRSWLARYPSCLGVDIVSILASLSPQPLPPPRVLMHRTHGSYWYHPIAQFPFVPTVGLPQENTRITGVWKREEGIRE